MQSLATRAAIEADDSLSDEERAEQMPAEDFDAFVKAVSENDAETYQDEAREYLALVALQEEAEGYGDWMHGAGLIRDSYFTDYAEQFAEDIGALPDTSKWPATCIDWEKAASELQQDYTSVDFDGVTYWIQS